MKTYFSKQLFLIFSFLIACVTAELNAAVKNSLSSGNWSSPSMWFPPGIPQTGDQVIIKSGHVITLDIDAEINSLTIQFDGEFKLSTGKTITLNNEIVVNGKMSMNDGDINLNIPALFILGANSVFTWEPATNTPAGATLFTNGIEHFDTTSSLIIKKWYNYGNVPLGLVVTGNFGNVTLNTISGSLLYEWNQNNQFELHKILGTLTVEQGWIVFDKSGSISNTTIGNINLATVNAYLDFHNGNHNGSFIVNTNHITNIGGDLHGIYNGNGNITLKVSGNFTNKGNVVLIYNTGVQNVANGNATLMVNGDYSQSSGDFRTIFNLTTFNAGIADVTFNNLSLTGGIMMGQYACHTSGDLSNFKVNGNLSINFSKATDKFRINGLTSLSGTFNNSKTNLVVTGNLIIAGTQAAEFTSSGSIGAESVSVGGNILISGCTNNFNMGSHQCTFNTSGGVIITGGTTSLSKTPGIVSAVISGNFNQSAGIFSIKGNTGNAEVNVNGNFTLTGGTTFLHSNMNTASINSVNLILKEKFTHTGGVINYDDNNSSTASNNIFIKGGEFIIGGNGSITRAGAGAATVFGMMNFSRQGIINFKRTSNTHTIQQVKQTVFNGCTVEVVSGNLQVSSHTISATDYMKISAGGTLRMGLAKIISNSLSAHSGVKVENTGKLATQNSNGLYNNADNACISATGNMNYYLAPNSIIEYYGNDSQLLTGIGNGFATNNDHKYGILEINFNGTPDSENVFPDASNVYIRTSLKLINGELNLNNNTIVIESGNAGAIVKYNGYVKSETFAAENRSFIKWMNLDTSTHVFPFGANSTGYIPFTFTPVSGIGGTISVATRPTGPDNLPFPSGSSLPPVTNLRRNGIDIAVSSVIDRWYDIIAPGFKANVTVTYQGSENTIADSLADSPLAIQAWNGSNWTNSSGEGMNVKRGIGTIHVNNATVFNHWIISTLSEHLISNDILVFDAFIKDKSIQLDWTITNTSPIQYFTIERSTDDIIYEEISSVSVSATNGEDGKYSVLDLSPLKGTSYYRIKQVNIDGKIYYSAVETINFFENLTSYFTIISVFPNPFSNHFTVSFQVPEASIIELYLTNSSGQIITTERITAQKNIANYEYYEKQNLRSGIYVLTLKYGDAVISKKLYKF